MSEEEITLNEFAQEVDGNRENKRQNWSEVKLQEVAYKRSENVDPQGVDLNRHVGLEHIEPNNPTPNWELLDDLSSTKRKFESGDILFAKLRPNLEKAAQPEFDGVASTDIFPIVAEQDINSKYLLYRLSSKPSFDYARRTSAGTRMPRTSWNLFSNFDFGLPPLSEQRKIATVLHTVDQAIQKTKEIATQFGRIKKGLKDKLLTKGLDNSETVDTRLGPVSTELPVHWDKEQIGELFIDRQLGTDERGSDADGENIDLIKMGNLDFGTWNLSEVEEIKRDSQLLEQVGLQKGDLLFNTRNTPELVGKTAVWDFDREAVYDNNLLRLRFGERIHSGHFVNAYFSSSIGRRQLRSRVHGTTSVAAIYWTDLQQIEIPVPPIGEQEQIVNRLRTVDETRKLNQSYRSQLKILKQGLMQDLLSGTVRTNETNIEVPDEIAQYG